MSKRLLLFDFDETYFKHNTNEEDLSHLREMEKLLEKLTNNNEVITAVLTGSTFQSVMDKMDQVNMTFKPLHIFSDLSSKMFTWNNGEYVESETYKKKVLSEPFYLKILRIYYVIFLRNIMSNLFHKEHLKVMKHIIIFIFIQQVITTMIGVF